MLVSRAGDRPVCGYAPGQRLSRRAVRI